MLTLNNLTYEIAGEPLFSEINWQLKPGDRVGLIGKNGAGKSTLLKIITGEYSPTKGEVAMPNQTRLGYLNQDLLSLTSDQSILEVALSAFEKELKLENQIDQLLQKMEDSYSDELGFELADLQDQFNAMDGYSIQSKTEKVLEGLGFPTSRLGDAFSSFSGGWRMRVILAKILLQQPDILLLDEPTNHLDLPAIEWLENYLNDYHGAVVIVSHDRTFLDRMVNAIGEIWNRKFYYYPGNYSNYLIKKEEWLEHNQKVFENQQSYIKQQERFIERFKAKASKAKQAQSKIKALEKLERVESIEDQDSVMSLNFDLAIQSGKEVLNAKEISMGYSPENPIFSSTDFTIRRGQKIAVIGANGKGKTTLLKIMNQHVDFQGDLKLGHNVVPSFFAQHQLEALGLEHEILEELQHATSERTDLELRTLLGCFLFTGDDVFKKIKVLSGGEKARVALAKTLVSGANFLLLDEPTNHLDIQSINILSEALNQFEGTLIMVSHDRYFINNVADEIWWIEDEQVKVYPGTYKEYLNYQSNRETTTSNQEKQNGLEQKSKKDYKKNKTIALKDENSQKSLEKKMHLKEEEMNELKTEMLKIDAKLAELSYQNKTEEIGLITEERKKVERNLDKLNQEYEELYEKMLKL